MQVVSTEERTKDRGARVALATDTITSVARGLLTLIRRLFWLNVCTRMPVSTLNFTTLISSRSLYKGSAKWGKKPAPPVTFQYADAYTPYGPIVGEKDGFTFFTLRPIASGGFFPDARNAHQRHAGKSREKHRRSFRR